MCVLYCGVIAGYCCNLYDWGAQRHEDILMHCITGASESVALQRCQDHRNVTCYFRLGFSAFSLISCWESAFRLFTSYYICILGISWVNIWSLSSYTILAAVFLHCFLFCCPKKPSWGWIKTVEIPGFFFVDEHR